MNLYLLSLLIYSLMILPVSVHFRVRLGRRSGYRVEFRAAGLPLRRTGPPGDPDGETPVSRKKGLRKLLSRRRGASSYPDGQGSAAAFCPDAPFRGNARSSCVFPWRTRH